VRVSYDAATTAAVVNAIDLCSIKLLSTVMQED
jgi:hypothetical protein